VLLKGIPFRRVMWTASLHYPSLELHIAPAKPTPCNDCIAVELASLTDSESTIALAELVEPIVATFPFTYSFNNRHCPAQI
jgi:hypothetical protein